MPSAVAAYSASYSFDIGYSVTGPGHSLGSKPTSTTVHGNTYDSSGAVQRSKSSYTVQLSKFLKSYITSPITANGTTYTRSYGTISSGTYNITVNKHSSTGASVKGSGRINQ